MNKKLLADLEFNSIIGEAMAQTATGAQLLNQYKGFLMNNESSYRLVNNFINEASMCRYDNGINAVLEQVSDYIQSNKTSWALASVCENLRAGKTSYNYLNQNAINQVEKLLENDEETVNKYIKAGALKNVMYVTEFRNVAKQVHHDMPIIESEADYKVTRPISFVESCGDGYMFEAAGRVLKVSADGSITEATMQDTSNTFRTVTSLLESNICSFDEVSEGLTINYNGAEYFINECGECTKTDKTAKKKKMKAEELRENNNLVVKATNPRHMHTVAQVLEAIALTCENFDHIAKMDNAGIYETKNDRFLVVNEGTTIYTTLLNSNHSSAWTYNCNVIEALEAIKKSTRVSLSEKFNEQVRQSISEASEEDKVKIEQDLKEAKIDGVKARIEALTEKFKNDPTKLAILSQVAQDLQTAEID